MAAVVLRQLRQPLGTTGIKSSHRPFRRQHCTRASRSPGTSLSTTSQFQAPLRPHAAFKPTRTAAAAAPDNADSSAQQRPAAGAHYEEQAEVESKSAYAQKLDDLARDWEFARMDCAASLSSLIPFDFTTGRTLDETGDDMLCSLRIESCLLCMRLLNGVAKTLLRHAQQRQWEQVWEAADELKDLCEAFAKARAWDEQQDPTVPAATMKFVLKALVFAVEVLSAAVAEMEYDVKDTSALRSMFVDKAKRQLAEYANFVAS